VLQLVPVFPHAVAKIPSGLMELIRSNSPISVGLPSNVGGAASCISVWGPANLLLRYDLHDRRVAFATLYIEGLSSFVASPSALISTVCERGEPGKMDKDRPNDSGIRASEICPDKNQ
jgi:hypothetical protein